MRRLLVTWLGQFSRSRRDSLSENPALRQQLAMLKLSHPLPRFAAPGRLFWLHLAAPLPDERVYQFSSLVQRKTVVRWHRAGFKLSWGGGFPAIAPAQEENMSAGNCANSPLAQLEPNVSAP